MQHVGAHKIIDQVVHKAPVLVIRNAASIVDLSDEEPQHLEGDLLVQVQVFLQAHKHTQECIHVFGSIREVQVLLQARSHTNTQECKHVFGGIHDNFNYLLIMIYSWRFHPCGFGGGDYVFEVVTCLSVHRHGRGYTVAHRLRYALCRHIRRSTSRALLTHSAINKQAKSTGHRFSAWLLTFV